MSTAYIGLGSNLGDKRRNLQTALEQLAARGMHILRVSSFLVTPPYGVPDQPHFLNAVCSVQTDLPPIELLRLLLMVEQAMGRVRLRHWGERIIDLDLLFYDDLCLHTPELELPHPDLQNRAFVLLPLAEIAPGLVHPVLGQTVLQLKKALLEREGANNATSAGKNCTTPD